MVQVSATPTRSYDELFRTSGEALIRAVYAYTGGRRDLAEEAVAEAFARAIERDGHIDDPLAWIYRVSFRIAAQEARRERRTTDAVDAEARASEPDGLGRLVSALRELSPKQRAAIVLHYEEDLPVAEVARLLGCTSATAKVHLHRGRNKLRDLLGDEEIDDD